MEVIDNIRIHEVEEGDYILINNEEVEVLKIIESADPYVVTLKVYSHGTGDVETDEFPYDYKVSLLGF